MPAKRAAVVAGRWFWSRSAGRLSSTRPWRCRTGGPIINRVTAKPLTISTGIVATPGEAPPT